eukprot:CAMPEP_0185790748 /NCGR_PEP_ID=MMETSP1174-20130828/157960_1 /TAXON_ID=35687 /ORGANISM="Dictyocha speculum, Strain CCMP1381" /LENGTH=456 /DNA_ID=CAMNT_0028485579 /DNA_START=1 /DNA_END=1371 /DNA_ORIENTATION=+
MRECSLLGLCAAPQRPTFSSSIKYEEDESADDDSDGKDSTEPTEPTALFLNTHEPFCLVTVGVQGGGKSHTLATVLEGCLIPCSPVVKLRSAMTAMVLHYDQNPNSVCEATGIISPAASVAKLFGQGAGRQAPALPKEKLTVLVSPSFFKQRKAFYGDYCTVRPLLFEWSSLSADHIKKLMRVKAEDSQLYMAAMLDLLRRYQRKAVCPSFPDFLAEVQALCKVPGQDGPLKQRLALLESLIAESAMNQELRGSGVGLSEACRPGSLVVVDLTDPLLAKDEANAIFQVLTEQFRSLPQQQSGGKLLVLDEAHKFMNAAGAGGHDGLSNAIVESARLMRHDGLRLAISTQSPHTLAPELLELLTVAVLHRFHSRDWLSFLETKLPLNGAAAWDALVDLKPGNALVFGSTHAVSSKKEDESSDGGLGKNVFVANIRPRLTADRGRSRLNTGASEAESR